MNDYFELRIVRGEFRPVAIFHALPLIILFGNNPCQEIEKTLFYILYLRGQESHSFDKFFLILLIGLMK